MKNKNGELYDETFYTPTENQNPNIFPVPPAPAFVPEQCIHDLFYFVLGIVFCIICYIIGRILFHAV